MCDPVTAGLVVGGSLLGSVYSADAAGDAADAQSDAINQAAAISAAAAEQARQDVFSTFGPSYDAFTQGIQSAKEQLVTGQETTSNILGQTGIETNQAFAQGTSDARADLLGIPRQVMQQTPQQQDAINNPAVTTPDQVTQQPELTGPPGAAQKDALREARERQAAAGGGAQRLSTPGASFGFGDRATVPDGPAFERGVSGGYDPSSEPWGKTQQPGGQTRYGDFGEYSPIDTLVPNIPGFDTQGPGTTGTPMPPFPSGGIGQDALAGAPSGQAQEPGPTIDDILSNIQGPAGFQQVGQPQTQDINELLAQMRTTPQAQQGAPQYGLAGAESAYTGGLSDALSQLRGGFGTARGDIQQGAQTARGDIAGSGLRAQGILGAGQTDALGRIAAGTQGAVGELDVFSGLGEQAAQREAAMSGALGPEAQAAAFQSFNESAGQQWLRERQEQSLIRNQAALGGLGGGNVRGALQEQAAGIAGQQQQQALANLSTIAQRGVGASTSQAGFRQQGGLAEAGLISDTQRAIAGIEQQTGMSLGQIAMQSGMSTAQLAAQLGISEADLTQATAGRLGTARLGIGEQLSGLSQLGAAQQAGTIQSTGQGLANLSDITSTNIANLLQQGGAGVSDLYSGLGNIMANIGTQQGTQQSGLTQAGGQAQSAGILGQASAYTGGMNNLLSLLAMSQM